MGREGKWDRYTNNALAFFAISARNVAIKRLEAYWSNPQNSCQAPITCASEQEEHSVNQKKSQKYFMHFK